MKKKYILLGLIVLSLLSIVFVGKYVLSNESHADPEAETHKIIVKNTTVDNKNFQATYRIKAKTTHYYYKIINVDALGESDRIIYNSYDDYLNNVNWQIVDTVPHFNFINSFTLNGNDVCNTGFGIITYQHFYCQAGSYYVKDESLSKIQELSGEEPIKVNTKYTYINELYKTTSYATLNNGKTYDVYTTRVDAYIDSYYIYSPQDNEIDDFDSIPVIVEYNFENQLGAPDKNGYYTFTLRNGETKEIQIPEGYEYEIEQLPRDGWEFISINEDTNLKIATGKTGETQNNTYTFKNDRITKQLIIKQETEDNQEGEFTYKVKANKQAVDPSLFGDSDNVRFIEIAKSYRVDDSNSMCVLEEEVDLNAPGEYRCGELEVFSLFAEPLAEDYYDFVQNYYGPFLIKGKYYVAYFIYYDNNEYKMYIIDDGSFSNVPDERVAYANDILDLSYAFGQPDEDGYYTFTLRNGDSKTIQIPEGYNYEIMKLTSDGWKLLSVNGSSEPTDLSGTMDGNITYTFLHSKISDDEVETPVNPASEDKPELPKTDDKVVPAKRSSTPKTIDKILIDVEFLTISVLVIGIMRLLIKRTK